MARPLLEVAEIFRGHGAAWRDANRGHVSLGQLKVMSAIESCRTAALGGMSRVARMTPAATPPLPTTAALWANSVMESWRAARWEIGSVFKWLRVDRTAVCSPLRRCPREGCEQNHALRYTRYSEGHFVDRTRDLPKSACAVASTPSSPLFHRISAMGPFDSGPAERPPQGQFVMESENL
jgi:hypothetical protein